MADWPCKNSSCRSFGQPHPHCQCGGPGANGYAEGGEVSNRCDSGNAHDEGCQYYVEGGEAIDPSQVQIMPQSDQQPSQQEPIDPAQVQIGKAQDNEPIDPAQVQIGEQQPTSKYETPGQQILTGVEGAARGLVGPLAPAAELGLSKLGVPGLSAEDQAGRQEANPIIHGASEAGALGASMFIGTGEARLAQELAQGAVKALDFGKIGSHLLQGGIEAATIQGGDEISKAMLGQGDPEAPVASALAHMGAAGLIGGALHGVLGKAGGAAGQGLEAIENAKLGTKAENFLRGLGAKSKGILADELEVPPTDRRAFEAGQKAYDTYRNKAAGELAYAGSKAAGVAAAAHLPGGIWTYEATQSILKPYLKTGADKIVSTADKYVPGAVEKAMSMGNTSGLFDLLDHAQKIGKGAQKMTQGVEGLFRSGVTQIAMQPSERDRARLRAYIEAGGPNEEIKQEALTPGKIPGYAEGGAIPPLGALSMTPPSPEAPPPPAPQANPISLVYPEQDMMLQAAKGRMYNYLNNLRPQPAMDVKPFDTQVRDKNKERTYDRALDVAHAPLSVLDRIKQGTITPEHVQHLNGIYPEVYNSLSKKIIERVSQAQMKGHKLDYKTRVAMSMFLGQPLDSTMTPQAIMAAQSSSMSGKQQPPPAPPKKSTAALSKLPQQYQTASQSLETRHQRQK